MMPPTRSLFFRGTASSYVKIVGEAHRAGTLLLIISSIGIWIILTFTTLAHAVR